MKPCPCGSGLWFAKCCKQIISGKKVAETAEQLMRSRYTAYTRANIAYIQASMTVPAAEGFDAESAQQWAQEAQWQKLRILKTTGGGTEDQNGTVEFSAEYRLDGQTHTLRENSRFIRQNQRWLYYDGTTTHA